MLGRPQRSARGERRYRIWLEGEKLREFVKSFSTGFLHRGSCGGFLRAINKEEVLSNQRGWLSSALLLYGISDRPPPGNETQSAGAVEKATGAPSSTLPGKLKRRTGKRAPPTVKQEKEQREPEQVAKEEPSERQRVWTGPFSDAVFLYRTLVRDQALPPSYKEAFVSLAPHIHSASSRQRSRLAAMENVQVALDLHEREKQEEMLAKRSEVARAQFMLAAAKPPKMFVSRLQRAIYHGPYARQKTEDAERVGWVRHLADLLAESPTLVGEALRSKPGDTSLLGAGRGVSTRRGAKSVQSGDS